VFLEKKQVFTWQRTTLCDPNPGTVDMDCNSSRITSSSPSIIIRAR